MSEMIRINEAALEHVTGGTHQEMMDVYPILILLTAYTVMPTQANS